jgi:hypothetical protein
MSKFVVAAVVQLYVTHTGANEWLMHASATDGRTLRTVENEERPRAAKRRGRRRRAVRAHRPVAVVVERPLLANETLDPLGCEVNSNHAGASRVSHPYSVSIA